MALVQMKQLKNYATRELHKLSILLDDPWRTAEKESAVNAQRLEKGTIRVICTTGGNGGRDS